MAAELASEFEVHVSQIIIWEKQALEALPDVFGRGQACEDEWRKAE